MKKYNKYKESNVAWLGEIPEHWGKKRIKHCFDERVEKGFPDEPLLSATQSSGVIPQSLYANRVVTAQKDLHLLKLVEAGDFVISLRSFQGGLEYAYYRGIISPAYTVMKPHSICDGYFRYLAKSKAFIGLLQTCVTGIREGQNIDYKVLKNHRLPIPSEEEQEHIVRYLDWKVTLADKFVEDKRKQIELFKEYRQAEINKAVTKGLNPDAPMRDSGIDWIGDIPVHWEYNRLSHLFQFGKGLNITKQDLGEEGYPCLNYGEIHSKFGFEVIPERDKLKCIKTDDQRLNDKSKLMRGDFIFADTSEDFEGSGNFTYFNSDADAYAGYHTVLLRPNNLVKDFRCLAYIADSLYVRTQIRNKVCGIKVFSVTKQILKDVFVYQPPIEEQQQIVAYLDTISERVKKAIEDIEQQIKLVTEYKTSLISDVVTGKVDIRGVNVPQ